MTETRQFAEEMIATFVSVRPEEGFYVYALINPINGMAFYIGKGKGNRYHHHERETTFNTTNRVKFDFIQYIKSQGRSIPILFYPDSLNEEQAYSLENILIRGLKDHLTNIANGSQNRCRRERGRIIGDPIPVETFDVITEDVETEELEDIDVQFFQTILNKGEVIFDGLIWYNGVLYKKENILTLIKFVNLYGGTKAPA